MELDVVAESADGKTLLVGECKLSLTAREVARELASLQAKVAQLPFAAKYEKVLTRLFVAQGGTAECVGLNWCE